MPTGRLDAQGRLGKSALSNESTGYRTLGPESIDASPPRSASLAPWTEARESSVGWSAARLHEDQHYRAVNPPPSRPSWLSAYAQGQIDLDDPPEPELEDEFSYLRAPFPYDEHLRDRTYHNLCAQLELARDSANGLYSLLHVIRQNLQVRSAVISVLDRNYEIIIQEQAGYRRDKIPRNKGLAAHAILRPEGMVVADTMEVSYVPVDQEVSELTVPGLAIPSESLRHSISLHPLLCRSSDPHGQPTSHWCSGNFRRPAESLFHISSKTPARGFHSVDRH